MKLQIIFDYPEEEETFETYRCGPLFLEAIASYLRCLSVEIGENKEDPSYLRCKEILSTILSDLDLDDFFDLS